MGMGDEVICAGQAQRAYDATGEAVTIVDCAGRQRWSPLWAGNPAIRTLEQGPNDRVLLSAPHARPYIVYPFTAESGWTFNREFLAREHVARIYLTESELALGRTLREELGPFILVDPWSKHPNLRWPLWRWEEFVSTNPTGLPIVQHTYDGSPALAGVSFAGTRSFREACGVLNFATVYVRGESGMCHAAAALDVPNVALWGGCMDWDVLGGYPKQRGVGIQPPFCGSYRACAHCTTCMAAVSAADAWRAVREVVGTYGRR